MKSYAEAGDVIFYDIYTNAEKAADPSKENTGLFFFKGTPGEKFAVCNAGGGFGDRDGIASPNTMESSEMKSCAGNTSVIKY